MNERNASTGAVETRVVRIALPPEGFRLESGQSLPELQIAYETYGRRSARDDNVVFLCHALSGNAHVAGHNPSYEDPVGWWDQMVGPGKGIDTNHYFVVCANILGGCKGTTGPGSVNPATGRPYGAEFPAITVGDMVAAHRRLLEHLGVARLAAVVGGSLGGMQALEWALRYPESVERCICIASSASLSSQALAFDIVGRKAITSDPDWLGGDYHRGGRRPDRGLALARQIGHITYLSPEMMTRKFGRERVEADSRFQVESYLDHQGAKFVQRFDANSYLRITGAIDQYDLEDRFGGLEKAFAGIRAKMLVVALTSDWLFPPEQSVEIANALLRAGKPVSYCLLTAPHGHDAFLVDIDHLAEVIRAFLPWVWTEGPRPESNGRAHLPTPRPRLSTNRQDYDLIVGRIRPGSRVLDIGCGDGELLSLLADRKGVTGFGLDIDLRHVIGVIDRGHDVFQADIDAGLAMIPDGAYDYAILSETLQVVRKPRLVLREMLRVAREGIVSFPNFGNWAHRARLLASGRMPKGHALPFEWYDTPNIHLFTLRDFRILCRNDGIRIVDMVCIPAGTVSRLLSFLGFRNLGADRALVRIRPEGR